MKICERYDRSPINLIDLMPRLTELRVFDNSADADPQVDDTRSQRSSCTSRGERSGGWSV